MPARGAQDDESDVVQRVCDLEASVKATEAGQGHLHTGAFALENTDSIDDTGDVAHACTSPEEGGGAVYARAQTLDEQSMRCGV